MHGDDRADIRCGRPAVGYALALPPDFGEEDWGKKIWLCAKHYDMWAAAGNVMDEEYR